MNKKLAVIGINEISLGFSLLSENDLIEISVFDLNNNILDLLKLKIFKTQEYELQELLIKSETLQIKDDLEELVFGCENIFFFHEIKNQEDEIFLFNFIRIISNVEILLERKVFFCVSLSPENISKIEKLCENKNIETLYCNLNIIDNSKLNGLKNIQSILIGTKRTSIDQEVINLVKGFSQKNINIHIVSIETFSVSQIFLSSYSTIKNSIINLFGDIMINSGLTNEINLVVDYLLHIDKNFKVKYGFGSEIKDEIKILDDYCSKINLKLGIEKNLNSLLDNHINNLKMFLISQNQNKQNPFVIKINSGEITSEATNKIKLCLELLKEGYLLNIICNQEKTKDILYLSNSFENRVKFYKPTTNPDGFVINID